MTKSDGAGTTKSDQDALLKDMQARVEQAISEFEADDGLTLQVRSHATQAGTGGYLEIVGRAGTGKQETAFAYRAAQAELEAHGDSWFTRKALRSLNDMYRAGHLPPAQGDGVDHQILKRSEEYRDDPYRS